MNFLKNSRRGFRKNWWWKLKKNSQKKKNLLSNFHKNLSFLSEFWKNNCRIYYWENFKSEIQEEFPQKVLKECLNKFLGAFLE